MATQHRPYQGYPYRDPPVTDIPSIDAATASRWADLPRRPLRKNVVYVDIPEDGSQVSESSGTDSRPRQDKKDLDANPVIYIEVPESSSSSVAEPVEPGAEPEYVQETIFYNPFDNRRIDQGKDAESVRSSDSDGSCSRPPGATRPTPPNILNLSSPGSSGYSSNYTTPGLPPSMSKEAYLYQAQDNGFPASPIPVSEFPRPPPAYTEIEAPVGGGPVGGVVENPRSPLPSEPPRTVVITPGSEQRTDEPYPLGLPNSFRKVVYCQHCGRRVHTLVIRQTGTATHVIALSFLCLALFPITILVYLTDTCKNKNHYCPNCNKLIGYEVPAICQKMTYIQPE